MSGDKKKDEDQDLTWQREEESDNLQKSERPDKAYMDEKNLCQQCQGVKRVCDLPACPQKAG
jgi:hypothetical protein